MDAAELPCRADIHASDVRPIQEVLFELRKDTALPDTEDINGQTLTGISYDSESSVF